MKSMIFIFSILFLAVFSAPQKAHATILPKQSLATVVARADRIFSIIIIKAELLSIEDPGCGLFVKAKIIDTYRGEKKESSEINFLIPTLDVLIGNEYFYLEAGKAELLSKGEGVCLKNDQTRLAEDAYPILLLLNHDQVFPIYGEDGLILPSYIYAREEPQSKRSVEEKMLGELFPGSWILRKSEFIKLMKK